ncbi:MAG: hypothetical protein EPO20_28835 [Betaproteobacteria bacterium]|nr:MAG: hypothetical protein EPO20_28835 [Betaproteobacteria bacterium]
MRRMILVALGAAVLAAAQAAGEDYAFMPKGGRALLFELLDGDAAELARIAQARRSEAQWREFADVRGKVLTERERATLAAYLAVYMPLPEASLAALPPDGRDLAWNQCQSCHSLFTSHLMQDRDAQAWRNMFESPFHRGIKMSAQEREEFARYSALNMPMKADDVPPELRF